jgi:hypothetical protein
MFDLTEQEIADIAKTAVDIFDEHDEADYRAYQFSELLREEVIAIRARRSMTARPNRSEADEQREWLNAALAPFGWCVRKLPNWRDGK